MISAGKLQNRCPGCRAQLLSFYDALLLSRNSPVPRPFLPSTGSRSASTAAVKPAATFSSRRPRSDPVRPFSTSRRLLEDPTPRNTPSDQQQEIPTVPHEEVVREQLAEEHLEDEHLEEEHLEEELDPETVVRQARKTFGNTLPAGYLSEEEYHLYERLYGPPFRETTPEDVGIPEAQRTNAGNSDSRTVLLKQTESGHFEEVAFTPNANAAEEQGDANPLSETEALDGVVPLTVAQLEYINMTANNQREYDALMKLQRDFEAAARLRPPKDVEEDGVIEEAEPLDEEEVEEDGEPDAMVMEEAGPSIPREHPNTALGKFGPNPSTIYLPKVNFVEPIAELLTRTDHSHIMQAAEKAFGGRGIPHSPFTPSSKRAVAQKGVGLEAGRHKMSEIEADTFLATVMPPVYASVMSTLVETRKRLGQDWIRGLLARNEGKGPRVLDVGGGGAGLLAWQEVLQAEWNVLREEGKVTDLHPPGKKTVIVGSDHLRHRISTMLHNTTFLPRLPDYLHSGPERLLDGTGTPLPRKVFDVIIVPHMLMNLEKEYKRKALLDNIWEMLNPEGGVLIVLEKGHPRGFEAVADVRDRLLSEFIIPPTPYPHPEELPGVTQRVRVPGTILAPCTNHHKCPMYLVPGLSHGRKDFCHFSQRFIRPPFLQKIFGAKHRNHEDVDFSYLVIQKGHQLGVAPPTEHAPDSADYLVGQEAVDRAFKGYEQTNGPTPHPLSLPRNILPPLKRHGHATLDLCTPAGHIERWTVPKSFSKTAYRDARKAQWGDLWALGAKTRTPRNVRLGQLGKGEGELVENLTDGGVRARRAAALAASGGRKNIKVVELLADSRRGIVGAREKHPGGAEPVERRTKGGKKPKMSDLIRELDEMDYPEEEDDEMLRGVLGENEMRGGAKRAGKRERKKRNAGGGKDLE